MIREMKYSDIERVLEILEEGINEGTSTFRRVLPTIEQWSSGYIDECRFVKEIDGKVVGWVALIRIKSLPAYRGLCEISIYVASDYRGLKIGDELLNKVIEESERCGIWTLESVIISDNIKSINLHKKHGFYVVGTRKDIAKDRFNNWKDVVILERRSDLY